MVDIATIKKKLEPYKMVIIVGALVGVIMYWHHASKNTQASVAIIGGGGYTPGEYTGGYTPDGYTEGYNPGETASPAENYNVDWVVNYYSVAPTDTTTVIASSSRTFMDAKYINLPVRFTDEQCIAACKQEKSDFANIGSVMPGVDRSCNCYKTSMQCIKYNGISNGVQKIYAPSGLKRCTTLITSRERTSTDTIYPDCNERNEYPDDEEKVCKKCTASDGMYVQVCDVHMKVVACPPCESNMVRVGCGGTSVGRCIGRQICKKFQQYDRNSNICRSSKNCPVGMGPYDHANRCVPCIGGTKRVETPLMNGKVKLVYDMDSKKPVFIRSARNWGYLKTTQAIGKTATKQIINKDGGGYVFEAKNGNAGSMTDIITQELAVVNIDEYSGMVYPFQGQKVHVTFMNVEIPYKCI